jgi:hypothetical protein
VVVPLSETDKAYLAGLFDGEGCINIRKGKSKKTRNPIFVLQVIVALSTGKDLEPWQRKTGLGQIYHIPSSNKKWSDYYHWRISNLQAENFLRLIFPYLITKKRQANTAFSFRATFLEQGGRGKPLPQSIFEIREYYKNKLHDLKGTSSKNRKG